MVGPAGITHTNSCCAGERRGSGGMPSLRLSYLHRRSPMRYSIYARVSTPRQAQSQSIEQQLQRLQAALAERGAVPPSERVFRDAGLSGASLHRPGLDRPREQAARAGLDGVHNCARPTRAQLCTPGPPDRGVGACRVSGGVLGPADGPGPARPTRAADSRRSRRI